MPAKLLHAALWLLTTTLLAPVAITTPLPPAYGGLDYTLPPAGSYALPDLGPATDGLTLDEQGKATRLYDLFAGRIVLLSFIYSQCNDINGCPLTNLVFLRIYQQMQKDPELSRHLRLITLSFDPEHDTPETMRLFARNFTARDQDPAWRFLTTANPVALKPILQAYGQDLQQRVKSDDSSAFSHILRVFLIDTRRRLRNIYSVSFLESSLLINDVRTVMTDTQANDTRALDEPRSAATRPARQPLELLTYAHQRQTGLPPLPEPADNPLTREKIALGRRLFFDRRLSLNNTLSCAMCHVPEQGFTSHELRTAVGIEGRSVRRNTPTLLNSGYWTRLFDDGRDDSLEQQIWGPLLARNEMGNPSVGAVIRKIKHLPGYPAAFRAAFGDRGIRMETLGMALASYERSLIAADSPFDRWRYGDDEHAISPSAQRGYRLFTGKAGCSSCHTVGADHALFTDDSLRNTGIGYRASMGLQQPRTIRVQLAPGVFTEVEAQVLDTVGEPPPADLGLYEITQNPADRWKYKVPSLRNVALTAPYMHDGSLATLAEVVAFYNNGGIANETLDPLIHPLHLSASEQQDLVAFLQSLTSPRVDALVADALSAPIGDTGEQAVPPTTTEAR